jgi:hypothetical protein
MSIEFLEKFNTEKNNNFDCLIINVGSIKELSWVDPQYSKKLMQLGCVESVNTNSDELVKVLYEKLISKYNTVGLPLKNEVFADELYDGKCYVYEIMYVDFSESKYQEYKTQENELASLINVNGDTIYSSAIILKTHLDIMTDSMIIESVTREDIERVLYDRVYTKIAIWDEVWTEDRVIGDLNEYAKIFFDNEPFEKKEFGFFMHNINIWYTTIPNGNTDLCGNLLKKPIDKCIWFTMKSDEFRGNLSLDEVKKIIILSKQMEKYNVPDIYNEEKTDDLGRKIIYNKYKILNRIYNEFN